MNKQEIEKAIENLKWVLENPRNRILDKENTRVIYPIAIEALEMQLTIQNYEFNMEVIKDFKIFADKCIEKGFTFNSLIKANEKQIPKKPYVQEDNSEELCMECPYCDSFLGYSCDLLDEHYQMNYCSHCGQSLDWSVEE